MAGGTSRVYTHTGYLRGTSIRGIFAFMPYTITSGSDYIAFTSDNLPETHYVLIKAQIVYMETLNDTVRIYLSTGKRLSFDKGDFNNSFTTSLDLLNHLAGLL